MHVLVAISDYHTKLPTDPSIEWRENFPQVIHAIISSRLLFVSIGMSETNQNRWNSTHSFHPIWLNSNLDIGKCTRTVNRHKFVPHFEIIIEYTIRWIILELHEAHYINILISVNLNTIAMFANHPESIDFNSLDSSFATY